LSSHGGGRFAALLFYAIPRRGDQLGAQDLAVLDAVRKVEQMYPDKFPRTI